MQEPQENSYMEDLKNLLSQPYAFFQKYESKKLTEMPLFYVMLIVFALFMGIDRIESVVLDDVSNGTNYISGWSMYWWSAVGAGIIAGAISFLIGSWFYNLRIKWSGAEGNSLFAQKVYLYTTVFIGLYTILTTLFDTFIYASPAAIYDFVANYTAYDVHPILGLIEDVSIFLLPVFLFHSLYMSYSSVVRLEGIKKGRALFWFLVLPGIVHVGAIIAVVYMILGMMW